MSPSSRARPGLALALACALIAGAGCRTKYVGGPGLYCDDANPCEDPYTCDRTKRICMTMDGGVGAPDLSRCTTAADCTAVAPVCAMGSCQACMGPDDDASCLAA